MKRRWRSWLGIALSALPSVPITPHGVIALFNGKDLSAFTTWLPAYGHDDPHHVFTVMEALEGAPAIRISGEDFGGLITRERYTDYRLVAEYRWGTQTWGRRQHAARDSGILLHCQGEDGSGARDFHGTWLRSIEFQIIEGGTGDLLLVGGYVRGSTVPLFPSVVTTVTPGTKRWNPAGGSARFSNARIDWLHRDPQWKDVTGFRGRDDLERPLGQWNHLEAVCAGGHLAYFVNGTRANEATDCSLREGRLLVQSEGAEIFFRRIELRPLTD